LANYGIMHGLSSKLEAREYLHESACDSVCSMPPRMLVTARNDTSGHSHDCRRSESFVSVGVV
jgi:hypothetical protein